MQVGFKKLWMLQSVESVYFDAAVKSSAVMMVRGIVG